MSEQISKWSIILYTSDLYVSPIENIDHIIVLSGYIIAIKKYLTAYTENWSIRSNKLCTTVQVNIYMAEKETEHNKRQKP